ncbi:HlyD family efflux transporter periplasmic adaptor subunit [Desulfobulbus rhabdoformis]|uniref:HlyD family efflux transporter periplasmic adaptor subunit n=1 Tax=Desulfobulbus rhabdoformis TaxID=34032 RepID=UPI00196533A2|nr:HlyD family efflux transporter periplasmic adaptor subunit [Desulfobulbus rhabdoformis]MBM9614706.1 HlyD family efflux transporter periplasmic adaptor subunit [Desulfobulbus rhabdoformis]
MESSPSEQQQTVKLWQKFFSASSETDYYRNWLSLQCHIVPQARQAILVLRQDKGVAPIAQWPAVVEDPQQFSSLFEQVLEERCGLIDPLPEAGCYQMAYPLIIDGEISVILALEVRVPREEVLHQIMRQLQWGIGWLELFFRRRQVVENATVLTRLQKAVDLLAAAFGADNFHSATTAFVSELAVAMQCERVSLGFAHNRSIRLEAVSHSSHFNDKMNLSRAIVQAMEEAIIQRKEIVYPPETKAELSILREHEQLARLQNNSCIASFPLYHHERYIGVLSCERPEGENFSQDDLDYFRAVVALVTPALELLEKQERPLIKKMGDAARQQLRRLFGPRYVGRKLIAALFLGAVVFCTFAKGEYRLTAQTELEAMVRRAVVAPYDGYIDQAPARAGDVVDAGALLCTLDDRDLRLERLAHLSQRAQLERQHQNAVAKYDRAQATIINARLEQATAELRLVEAKLSRSQLSAPFAGLLVSGDLSQRLGGAVDKGEILFEVTPLSGYRVILQVDERWIEDVRVGQLGKLVLASRPESLYPFTISQITPLTASEDGRTFFRVEAKLDTIDSGLRPGMEGIGKISIDRRLLISIWTRELREWLRLFFWRWMP